MSTTKDKHSHHDSDYDILYHDMEKIKAALREASHDVKEKAAEMIAESVEEMKDETSAIKDNVAKYTAEKPFKSLGIALLAGIAIGLYLRK